MSTEDPDVERLRRAFDAVNEGAPPGPRCADPARIWSAARGELRPAEAQALLDHALACPACGLAWRLACQVTAESGAVPIPQAPRQHWTASHWAAVAALVIAAVLIPVGVHEWRAPRPPAYRADERETIRPLVPEGSALPRENLVLRWSAGPPGTRYSVRLIRSDLGVIAEAGALDSTEYVAPAEALVGLPGGTVLYWRVEAHLPDGKHIISDTFSLRLE